MSLKVSFPHDCENIIENGIDIDNNFIDVWVEFESDYTNVVMVATAKYIEVSMDEEGKNFRSPTFPFIVVKKLTRKIIQETMEAYAKEKNGYWLKFYDWAGRIDQTVFSQL